MAVVFHSDNYDIHELYDKNANAYHVCLPNNNLLEYNVYVGFQNKQNVVDEINDIYSKVGSKQTIYIHLNVPQNKLKEAADENDDKLYQEVLGMVGVTLHSAYQFIIKEKLAAVNQVIIAIKQTKEDTKFIDWLEIKNNKFIKSVFLNDITRLSYDALYDTIRVPIVTDDDSSGTALSGGSYQEIEINKGYTKKRTPKSTQHSGSVKVVMLTLISCILGGTILALLILKLK